MGMAGAMVPMLLMGALRTGVENALLPQAMKTPQGQQAVMLAIAAGRGHMSRAYDMQMTINRPSTDMQPALSAPSRTSTLTQFKRRKRNFRLKELYYPYLVNGKAKLVKGRAKAQRRKKKSRKR